MIVLGGVDETEPFDLTDGEVGFRSGGRATVVPGRWRPQRGLGTDIALGPPTDPAYYTPEYLMALADLPVGRAMPEGLRADT